MPNRTEDGIYKCSSRTGVTAPEWNGRLFARMVLPFVDMTTKGFLWCEFLFLLAFAARRRGPPPPARRLC